MEASHSERHLSSSAPVLWRYCEFGRHRVYLQPCGTEGWRALIVPRVGRGRSRSVYGPDLETATRRAEEFIKIHNAPWFSLPQGRHDSPHRVPHAY